MNNLTPAQQALYQALLAAQAQLAADLNPNPIVLATVQADITAVENAAAAFEASLTPVAPVVPPVNVAQTFQALQAALTQLAQDMAANPFVLATVQNDAVTLQTALTAFEAALSAPSNP